VESVRQMRINWQLLVVAHLVLTIGATALGVDAGQPWLEGWTKLPQNPMLSLSNPGSFDSHNIFAPAIVKQEDRYFLYYSGGPSGPLTGEAYIDYQLGLATSDDGVNFTKQGSPLLPLGLRDDFHATPALLRDARGDLLLDDDGTWHMVFNGNRADDVEHATSTDGINWQKDTQSPIYQSAYSPSLLKVDDEYWMYYIKKPSGRPWELHMAKGPDLYSLAPISSNPVLTRSQPWEQGNLFYPYVFKEDSTWVMFYAGYWNDPAGGAQKTAIGTATSADGVNWVKNPDNPIFTPTPGSAYDSRYTSSQSILRDDDVYRMFYAGRVNGTNKYFSINQATKPVGGSSASTYWWDVDGFGLWNTATNWFAVDGGIAIPSGDDVSVLMGSAISGPSTVVLDSDVIVKSMQFSSVHSYAIAGIGSINLAADEGNALIDVTEGSHQFQTTLQLHQNTDIHIAEAASLELNNRLNLQGNSLVKSGPGVLSINNIVTSGGGNIVMTSGVVVGSGALIADLWNTGAIVSPGNSQGLMQVIGNYSQGNDATLLIEVAGTVAVDSYDVLEIQTTAELQGTLHVALIGGFQPDVGDHFHILQAGSIQGEFDKLVLPELKEGLSWDDSALYASGVISVVPEPQSSTHAAFGMIGAWCIWSARRMGLQRSALLVVGVEFPRRTTIVH